MTAVHQPQKALVERLYTYTYPVDGRAAQCRDIFRIYVVGIDLDRYLFQPGSVEQPYRPVDEALQFVRLQQRGRASAEIDALKLPVADEAVLLFKFEVHCFGYGRH